MGQSRFFRYTSPGEARRLWTTLSLLGSLLATHAAFVDFERQSTGSEYGDVFGLRFSGLAILADLEADLIAFAQRATGLEGRHVNEDIPAATIRRDESKTLVAVEEFNSTSRHRRSF
jgi:hypothetical protein